MQIHDRINALREAEKISMRQLAKELGVSYNTISKWERNPYKFCSECVLPTRDNVPSLARSAVRVRHYLGQFRQCPLQWTSPKLDPLLSGALD